ncbi:Chitin synthase export chaperone [Nakaseomyces bracarensis]|uniref:Chitin synthase export chaperone n=1 Tax=Nakaseomyces bracarensis TaxID=273131 RepID=A0ABR4NN46_9SACH
MGISNFASICSKTPLPLCSVVKSTTHLVLSNSTKIHDFDPQHLNIGILPKCYARSIDVANTVIFGIANAFINIGALGVILIILYNIRQKYTAIGRSEYLYFYQLALLLILFTLIVNCGVSPPGSDSYPYFVAVQIGFAGACCWTLLINGFLGFNLWEDGTRKSMLLVRGASICGFSANFLAAILTFRTWIENHEIPNTNTTGLFVVVYLINLINLFIFVICQLLVSIVVVRNLWVTGAVLLGVFFFVVGQILTYALSSQICEGVKHYLDGLFFGSICNIFTLMMVYKTWDITTDDDLEFSVSVDKNGDVIYH